MKGLHLFMPSEAEAFPPAALFLVVLCYSRQLVDFG